MDNQRPRSGLSAPNTTNYVLINSPKRYSYFPFKQFGRIFSFIFLYIFYMKKIDVDIVTGAEKV